MKIIAHRGLHDHAPENSLPALEAAIAARLSLIEVDLRVTSDGGLFLLHDATLDRTTRLGGRLARMPAAAAARVRLLDGSPLPRLADALRICADRALLCLDVKDREAAGPLLTALRRYEDVVEVWSPHVQVVERAAAVGVRAALICSGVFRGGVSAFLHQARQAGAVAVSFYPADVEPRLAAACAAAGMPFYCGVPNDRRSWRYLSEMGATAVITDRPLICLTALTASAPPVAATVGAIAGEPASVGSGASRV